MSKREIEQAVSKLVEQDDREDHLDFDLGEPQPERRPRPVDRPEDWLATLDRESIYTYYSVARSGNALYPGGGDLYVGLLEEIIKEVFGFDPLPEGDEDVDAFWSLFYKLLNGPQIEGIGVSIPSDESATALGEGTVSKARMMSAILVAEEGDPEDPSLPMGWHRHANGGGAVEDTAQVEDTVYVGPTSYVGGFAQVLDNAKLTDYGRVVDHAKVYGNAEISDKALVHFKAEVFGNAKVYGGAHVGGNAKVYGNAHVDGHIDGDTKVYGEAHVGGHLGWISTGEFFESRANNEVEQAIDMLVER